MDQETKDAVRERLSLGYSEEKIINELVAAGYPEDLAAEVYGTVIKEDSVKGQLPIDEPIEEVIVSQAQVIQPAVIEEGVSFNDNSKTSQQSESTSPSSPLVTSSPKPANHRTLVIVLAIALVVVLSGFIYAAAFGGFQTIQEYFSGLLSSAPYKNEGEMITGLVSTSYQMKAFSFNTDYNVELQPRAPETLVYENSDLDSLSKLSGQEIPTEGNLNFSISGLVDIRDETNPEFDLDMNLNALLEPFIIQLGAGVRLTEGNLYAKITDIPAMFKSQMPMEIPVDTWILLASAEEKDRFMEDIPVLKQTLKPVESLFSGLNSTLFANLLLVGEDSVLSKNGFAVNQLASGVQALGLQTSAMTDDQKHMVEYTVAALEQNPPIKFVSDPKKIVKDGETLYEYEVDVDYDNLMTFINSMAEESHSVYGRGEDISVLMGEIPSREDFEVFNELVDLKFTFRTDGSIQGVYVGSVFVPGGGEVKAQVDVKFETTFGHNNEAIDITMPDNVHPKSLSDMFSEMQKQYQQDNYDMTVKVELTRMRSMAELIYNENDYSYASVCSELRSNPIYTVATECSANDSEYVIYTALLYEPTYFCIDSTGAAWEVLLPPDEGAYSCPSGLPEDPSVTSSVSMEDAIPQYQSDFISP